MKVLGVLEKVDGSLQGLVLIGDFVLNPCCQNSKQFALGQRNLESLSLLGKAFTLFSYLCGFMVGVGTESRYFLINTADLGGRGVGACCNFLGELIRLLLCLVQLLRRYRTGFYLIGDLLEFCIGLVKIEVLRFGIGGKRRDRMQKNEKAQAEREDCDLSVECGTVRSGGKDGMRIINV